MLVKDLMTALQAINGNVVVKVGTRSPFETFVAVAVDGRDENGNEALVILS